MATLSSSISTSEATGEPGHFLRLRSVAGLPFSRQRPDLHHDRQWELVAAVRPMIHAKEWKIDRSPGREIFQDFIEQAKQRL